MFKGRIGRARYWGLTSFCMLAFIAAYFLMILAIKYTSEGPIVSAVAAILSLLIFLATCVAFLGIGVRRLHDRGKSGFWIILYYVVPFILAIAAMDPDGQRDALDWVALAIVVCAIVDLGVLEGKAAESVAT
jgi:uncharacterized membrane protein YhaH (DUF805 family)